MKKILKKDTLKVIIKDFKAPSILKDTNRFFKSEMEEAKRLFFS